MAICWKILEINSTSDEKAIRRAYAKKLKVTRPDEDPAGYQALRAAFDEALIQAAYQREYEERAAANCADSLREEEADLAELMKVHYKRVNLSHVLQMRQKIRPLVSLARLKLA